ncbi:lipoprotein-releasing ABC transporter permease subunit LolC [Candidatus Fukatsuia anoeciicola]|uniref:lipoprotein-releasing ABC transporter permease subunit LolC n=1 Tax=Candidatus Fukatsuia anoeciicola TaxID=2994492 RepID=UPI0034641C2E
MYQFVTLFIGLRYIRGRTSDRFGRFVSWFSTIGITLGVIALVMVLSVMNGFESNLQNKILQLIPQVLITTKQGFLDPQKIPISTLKELRGVNKIVPLTTSDVILQSIHSVGLGVILGINPQQYEPLANYFVNVRQEVLQPGRYNLIIGIKLAQELDVKPGDSLRLIVPSVSQLTPMGRIPSQRLFNVSGIFTANSEVDNYQLLLNQQDASRLMHYPLGNITGWRLFLLQPLQIDRLQAHPLPIGVLWKDWRLYKGDLFQAVHMEKNIIGLLLSLIIAVAAFNIVTSLVLLITEKQGEIAILQTLGLSRGKIMSVFMIQGASTGIIGAFIGAVVGVILASQLSTLISFLDFLINGISLPVVINPLQVALIILLAILIALLSTLYPAWSATAIQPAKALRYE